MSESDDIHRAHKPYTSASYRYHHPCQRGTRDISADIQIRRSDARKAAVRCLRRNLNTTLAGFIARIRGHLGTRCHRSRQPQPFTLSLNTRELVSAPDAAAQGAVRLIRPEIVKALDFPDASTQVITTDLAKLRTQLNEVISSLPLYDQRKYELVRCLSLIV